LYNARRIYIYWIIISKKSYKNSESILLISDPFTERVKLFVKIMAEFYRKNLNIIYYY